MTTNEVPKKRKGRSPSYPGINLEAAIARAKALYEVEHQHAVPMATITKHWGYKTPLTGPASVNYAALRKFGLLQDEGTGPSRMGRLTELALDIVLNPDPHQRLQAIRRAALTPPIHAELWDQFKAQGGPPSDDAMRYDLVRNRGFTETGAAEFIQEFRDTVAFAQLADAVTIASEEEEPNGEAEIDAETDLHRQRKPRPRLSGADVLSIPVPIAGRSPILVEGEFPVSEADWVQFIAVLNAMKPGLVADPGSGKQGGQAEEDPTHGTFLPDPPEAE
jgi:hypothetical protein